MTLAEQQIADSILSYQLDLFRLEAHTRAQALELLDRLGVELEAILRRQDITAFTRARTQQLLNQATEIIDRYYAALQTHTEATLTGMARVQANAVAQSLNATLVVTTDAALPTTAFLSHLLGRTLIEGAASAAWWKKQSSDTAFRFAAAVRQGMIAGETNSQILTRVVGTQISPGIMQVSKSNARSLIHSSIQATAAAARRETFQKNRDIFSGIRQVSTLDSHTSLICVAYSNAEWDMDYKPINGTTLPFNGGIPRHWNCRSVEVPIIQAYAARGPQGMRASSEGPISAKTTFDQFLKRKGVAFQDEVLGKGRAALWRKGTINLSQLLDLKSNPLTLAQLQRRYA